MPKRLAIFIAFGVGIAAGIVLRVPVPDKNIVASSAVFSALREPKKTSSDLAGVLLSASNSQTPTSMQDRLRVSSASAQKDLEMLSQYPLHLLRVAVDRRAERDRTELVNSRFMVPKDPPLSDRAEGTRVLNWILAQNVDPHNTTWIARTQLSVEGKVFPTTIFIHLYDSKDQALPKPEDLRLFNFLHFSDRPTYDGIGGSVTTRYFEGKAYDVQRIYEHRGPATQAIKFVAVPLPAIGDGGRIQVLGNHSKQWEMGEELEWKAITRQEQEEIEDKLRPKLEDWDEKEFDKWLN